MIKEKQVIYLSQADVVNTGITMSEIVDVVERGFVELGNDRVEMPPKPGIHPGEGDDNFIHAMPAYIPAMKSAGIKWVSGYPGNQSKGLAYINGLLILNNPDTGVPIAVMDCAWITAMRTGAASAVSAKYLAKAESSTIGILGCGVQGHTNLEAMNILFPLKRVKAFDPSIKNMQKFSTFGKKLGVDVETVDQPKDAVGACDIIVTCGPLLKEPHETIQAGWVDQGTFLSLVDLDSYFSREALKEADKWTTDHLGQYNYFKEKGVYLKNCPPIYAELGELVTGKKKGRESPDEINFAANIGIAMEDISLASLIYKQAIEKNIGTWLPL